MQESSKARVIVLSADEGSAEGLVRRLEGFGHRALFVGTHDLVPGEALPSDLDLLVVDTGTSFDARQRTQIDDFSDHHPASSPPIAVVLADPSPSARGEAWRAGADDVIDPAVPDVELEPRIRRLVCRAREERATRTRSERVSAVVDRRDAEGVVIMDAAGGVEFANDAAGRVLGLEPEVLRQESLPGVLASMGMPRDVIARIRGATAPVDAQLDLSGSGDDRLLQLRCRPLPIADDGQRALGIYLRDLTVERDEERRKADFHSMIAHDLRSPISVIQGYLELLGTEDPGVALDEVVSRMRLKVEDVSRLLQDFLDFSMLDAGFLRLEPAPLDVRTVLAETERDVAMLAGDHAARIVVEVDPGVDEIELHGDAHRLRQVLQNLVGNALKYGGGGEEISIQAAANARGVRISVRDQGPGVAPEDREIIFERYQRARRDRGDGRGIGLGLMIVRRIVEGHGGAVGVDSEVGRGSTFWFEIPPVGAQGRIASVIPTY